MLVTQIRFLLSQNYRLFPDELMVIVEYCKFGNLQNILRAHRCRFVDQINRAEDIIDPSISRCDENPEYKANSSLVINSPSGE